MLRPRRLVAIGVALFVVAALLVWGVSRQGDDATAGEASPTGLTILLGTGGITWQDITPQATPHLWAMMRDGSAAAMTVRSVSSNTCPTDAWLGLSAGQRAAVTRPELLTPDGGWVRYLDRPCPPPQAPVAGVVPHWDDYLAAAEQTRFGARPGLLAEQLEAAGGCVAAIGPGAAIAGARPDGTIQEYADLAGADLVTALTRCPVTVVDVGSGRDPQDASSYEDIELDWAAQVAAVDEAVGRIRAAAPAGANLIVASMSDAGRTSRLRMAVATGPDYGPGLLASSSTRQDGLVQTADLTVTLLQRAGVPVPTELGGSLLQRRAAPTNSEQLAQQRYGDLVDYGQASATVKALVPPFFNTFAYAQLAIYLFVMLVWKGRLGNASSRLRSLRIARVVGVTAASVPAATFLANTVPWWRFPVPMLAVVTVVAAFTGLIAMVALRGPWGTSLLGPTSVVAGVTMLVLGADVVSGSRLQLSSLMGLQPAIGGRYYGFGNVAFALFMTSALLLAIAVANHFVVAGRRRDAAVGVVVIGLVAIVVDGSPTWGADGGGPPAMIPAFSYLALTMVGVRLTWRRWAALAAATTAAFFAVSFLDWLRPVPSRSHLGRFFQALLDGTAHQIVLRKAQQNLDILLGKNIPLTILVPFALAFVIYVLARETSWGSRALQRAFDRLPTLRPGLVALVLGYTIGFGINDSGVAIPAVGAMMVVPLLIAINVRVLEDDARADARRSTGRRVR